MNTKTLLKTGFATASFWLMQGIAYAQNGPLVQDGDKPLNLLQPLDDQTTQIGSQSGIDMVFAYFNMSWPYVVGTVAGVAVLQGVIAGVQIMYAGTPEGVANGKERFMWAVGGMIILGLAGVILRTLNPIFYV
jgi:hypothetical protein